MAEQRIDAREVRKIKTAIALDGKKKAERRFGNSPEMQQVQQQLQKGQARAVDRHRAARHDSVHETKTKENKTMGDKQHHGQQKPAPATAQQRVTRRQQAQARQNARLKDRSKNQSQGMGM